MAFEIGHFFATLGLDTGGYTKGLLNAQSLNAAFGQSFTNFIANPIAGGIALLKDFAGSFVRANLSILQTAQDLRRLSQETGASTELIQALTKTLEANGSKAEFAQQGVLKLANQIGAARREGGAAAEILTLLVGSLDSLGNTDSAIRSVLDALAGIEDPALRARLAAQLLGEQAGPALANQVRASGGSVRALVDDIRGLGQIIDNDGVLKLNALKDALGRVEQNFDGIKTQALVAFLQGFSGEVNTSNAGIDALARSIRNELIPAMESLGKVTGSAARGLKDIGSSDTLEGLKEAYELIKPLQEFSINTLVGSFEALNGSALQRARLARPLQSAPRSGVGR